MIINQLNPDYWAEILCQLEPKEALKCLEVSKTWQKIIKEKFHDLKTLNEYAYISINLKMGSNELAQSRFSKFVLDLFSGQGAIIKNDDPVLLKVLKVQLKCFVFACIPLSLAPIVFSDGCSAVMKLANPIASMFYIFNESMFNDACHIIINPVLSGYIFPAPVILWRLSFSIDKLVQSNFLNGPSDCLNEQIKIFEEEARIIKQNWNPLPEQQ